MCLGVIVFVCKIILDVIVCLYSVLLMFIVIFRNCNVGIYLFFVCVYYWCNKKRNKCEMERIYYDKIIFKLKNNYWEKKS